MSGRPEGLLALPGPLLDVAAALYGLGARGWHAAWDRGWRRATRLPVPVLSVGNLTVGGTGKTPAVRALAAAAERAGFRPAILTRGYGRRGGGAIVIEAGRVARRPGAARYTGDEPLLLSRALPRVPVLVGSERAALARDFLEAGSPVDLFLLDDGFQHRALARDADLVLVDAAAPFGNGRLLPAGILREPPAALGRATALLVTGVGTDGAIPAETAARLDAVAPGRPRWAARTRLERLVRLEGGGERPVEAGLRVHAVAAIARPVRFRRLLEESGCEIAGWTTRRDHHPWTAAEVTALERAAAARGAILVTTTKDAVRLEERADPGAAWWVAETNLVPGEGWDAVLAALLKGNGGP